MHKEGLKLRQMVKKEMNESKPSYSSHSISIPDLWHCQIRYFRWNWIFHSQVNTTNAAGIYLLKVNNRNTRTMCEICSKLTIKPPENVIDVVLVALLLTFNRFHIFFGFVIVDFEQVNAG